VLPQGFRHLHFAPFQDADELQSVNDSLALKVIVGDDEGVGRMFGDVANARDPGIELFGGIEIVVAFMGGRGGIVGEPGVVAAAVQSDVAHGRSAFRGGFQGTADDGLVDVAEGGMMLAQHRERLAGLPGSVAKLDGERVIGKTIEQRGEIADGFLGAVKRKGELQKHGAESASFLKNVETSADGLLVVRCCGWFVGEFLPEFGGEEERGVGRHALQPSGGVFRAQWVVERRVDLDGVEELREISGLVEVPGASRGVNIAKPIGIGPSGRADEDAAGGGGFCGA